MLERRYLGHVLCLLFCAAFTAMPAGAAVIHARSGHAADLQAAINSASTGDTISVPSGRFSFTGTVYAPDGIYIRGAGRDSTFLVKSDNSSVPMIIVDAKTGLPFKFSDITLQGRLDALQGAIERRP